MPLIFIIYIISDSQVKPSIAGREFLCFNILISFIKFEVVMNAYGFRDYLYGFSLELI